MAVKVKETKNKKGLVKEEYPRLMQGKMSGIVILMTGKTTGVVVMSTASSAYKVGYHSACWSSCALNYYTGTLKMSNK